MLNLLTDVITLFVEVSLLWAVFNSCRAYVTTPSGVDLKKAVLKSAAEGFMAPGNIICDTYKKMCNK